MRINKKYKPLLENKTRYFIVTGGRGSGKSFGITGLLTYLLLEAGHKILYTRYTLTSAAKSIIPEFLEKIDLCNMSSLFYTTKTELINMQSGSRVIFSGLKTSSGNQTAALKSINGITTFVLDEAEELTNEDEFDTIDLSIRKLGIQNRVILILNPATKSHWIYKRFFEAEGVAEDFNGVKGDVTYISTNYLDNYENLADSFKRAAERMRIRRPIRYLNVMLGAWRQKAEGVIFNNWVIGDYVAGDSDVFGQDFGFSIDPTTLVKLNINKAKKTVHIKELLYKAGLNTSAIRAVNDAYCKGSIVYADNAEGRLISELNQSEAYTVVAAKKGAGSIKEGIKLLQDYDLIISPDSYNLITELNNYQWAAGKANPVDTSNHLIDAIRYAFTSYLKNPNHGEYFL